jgi:hypothetical protein
VVEQRGKGWMHVLYLGRRGPHRCSQDRMLRYPDYLASGPGRLSKGAGLPRQRIDQSIVSQFTQKNYRFQYENSRKRVFHQHPFAIGRPSSCLQHLQPWSIWRRKGRSCHRSRILLAMTDSAATEHHGVHLPQLK